MKKLAWTLHIFQCSVHIYFIFFSSSPVFGVWSQSISLYHADFFFLSGLTDCLLLSNWVIWLISASDFLRCWVLFFHKLKSGFLCLGTFPLFSPSFFWTVCTGCLFLFMYLLFFPTLQEEHCHKEITSPLLSVTSGQETVCTEGPDSQWVFPKIQHFNFSGI